MSAPVASVPDADEPFVTAPDVCAPDACVPDGCEHDGCAAVVDSTVAGACMPVANTPVVGEPVACAPQVAQARGDWNSVRASAASAVVVAGDVCVVYVVVEDEDKEVEGSANNGVVEREGQRV